MKARWVFLSLSTSLCTAVIAFVLAGSSLQKGKAVDCEALAQKLVNQCAAIHEGEYVLVSGGMRDMELLEDIAINVRKVGAYPLLTVESDRMNRRMYTDVPAKYDSVRGKFDEKIYGIITAGVFVEYNDDPELMKDISPDRIGAVAKAYGPLSQLLMKRGFRQVELGNGMYPTAATAKLYGMSLQRLSDVFWSGVNVDYPKLQEKGAKVRAALEVGREVHVTNPNGTDLTFRIEGRPVFVSDGSISAEDQKRGTAGCLAWLPAGEVYVTPVVGTAEGTVVVDRQLFQGKEIKKLVLTFESGKLKSMTAKSGLEPLKKYYDAQADGKEWFALVDIGINPNVKSIKGSNFESYVIDGMISVNLGGNDWAGGENSAPWGLTSFLPGSSLSLDGKTLVENGTLKF
jgi:aminopeptidase